MSQGPDDASPDLIRWTFTIDPDRRPAIEGHLEDLGADVFVREGGQFHVSWEEPESSLDGVIEAIWSLHGTPFEVTQEEFRRLGLHVLEHADDEPSRDAA